MKFLILTVLCFIQSVYTFSPMNFNKPIKYYSNNNYVCTLSNNNKENILSNAIKVFNSAVSTHTNNKKWNPPIGYVPDRIKKVNKKFKKWNPPIGYIPESLKNKKIVNEIVNEIDNKISNVKNKDLLFTNINDETRYINEQANKLEEETKILKDIIKKINYHTNNIATVTLYRNEDNNNEHIPINDNYWHGNIP